ncbi:MAG: helix-turn-helix domain-containing protein, partial [Nostocoides sp.]
MAPDHRPKHDLKVTDSAALKALAHPARRRLINELAAGRVLTATEASELVGLSPSAVSHHLRALARYGFAERAETSEDGRERPWRALATGVSFNPSDAAGARVINTLIQDELQALARNLAGILTREIGDDSTRGMVGISSSETWLTDDERATLLEQLESLLDSLPKRHSRNAPEGATRVSLLVSL